jgi:hypothetical protein
MLICWEVCFDVFRGCSYGACVQLQPEFFKCQLDLKKIQVEAARMLLIRGCSFGAGLARCHGFDKHPKGQPRTQGLCPVPEPLNRAKALGTRLPKGHFNFDLA